MRNVQLSFGCVAIRQCGVCGCYSYIAVRILILHWTEKTGQVVCWCLAEI